MIKLNDNKRQINNKHIQFAANCRVKPMEIFH